MGKTKNKLKADVVVKNYWRNNEQFADFFNAVLYEGKQVIKPDELEDMDTEESYVSENKKYVESVLASRDNIKIRKKSTKHDVELCILGMESQEHIHYAMPMRVMDMIMVLIKNNMTVMLLNIRQQKDCLMMSLFLK